MSAYTAISQCWFLAREIEERQDELDPISRLACYEALGVVLSRLIPNVPEFSRDSAEQKADDLRTIADAQRKAITEDQWAAAVGHASVAGPGRERLADLLVLFS